MSYDDVRGREKKPFAGFAGVRDELVLQPSRCAAAVHAEHSPDHRSSREWLSSPPAGDLHSCSRERAKMRATKLELFRTSRR